MPASIAACLPSYQEWKIQILGTDIGAGVAQRGLACSGPVPCGWSSDEYRRRFFAHICDPDMWKAAPALME